MYGALSNGHHYNPFDPHDSDSDDDPHYSSYSRGQQGKGLGRPKLGDDQELLMQLEQATYNLAKDLLLWKLSRLIELRVAKQNSIVASRAEQESTKQENKKLRELELVSEKENEGARKSNKQQQKSKVC